VLLLASAVEAYAFKSWGRERGMYAQARPVDVDLLIRYETAQLVLSLVVLVGGAWLLKLAAEGFHRRHTYEQSFVTAAHSLAPMFLCRALNAIPGINMWVTWAIGIFLTLSALYRGIPRVMKPDPSNALGLYMMGSFMLLFASGLANFLAILVLEEKILV
jgi:hypothetical protein